MINSLPGMSLRGFALAAVMGMLPISASATEIADRFWAFAQTRCIMPMEAETQPDKSEMKLSGRSVALIPALSNAALAWETRDGQFFMSMEQGHELGRCSIGFRDPNIRRNLEDHQTVIDAFQTMATEGLANGRYTVTDTSEEDGKLLLELLSTDWREVPIRITFYSDPESGRLSILIVEIYSAQDS